MIGVVDSEITG